MKAVSIDYNEATYLWSILENLSDKVNIAIIKRLCDALLHSRMGQQLTSRSRIVGLCADA